MLNFYETEFVNQMEHTQALGCVSMGLQSIGIEMLTYTLGKKKTQHFAKIEWMIIRSKSMQFKS